LTNGSLFAHTGWLKPQKIWSVNPTCQWRRKKGLFRRRQNAASLAVAEKYVAAFQELARTNNTLILPANTGDVSSMVAQVINPHGLPSVPTEGQTSAAL
jgi:hypothetical protein